jgi:outer membrane protein OmpA-like peptidoglycan-associated protein
MRIPFRAICTICTSFLLLGCSYFDTGEEPPVTAHAPESVEMAAKDGAAEPPPVIDIEKDETVFTGENAGTVGSAPPAAQAKPEGEFTSVSGGSVDLYSLGEPPPPPPEPVSIGGSGMYTNDKSVEVYPVNAPPPAPMPLSAGQAGEQSFQLAPLPALPVERQNQMLLPISPPGQSATRVYFPHGATMLTGPATETVARLPQHFTPGAPLSVEGHASVRSNLENPVQRQIVNLKVSMDRAFTVAKEMIENGVPAETIRTVGWGENHPAPAVVGMDDEAASRRVEVLPR